MVAGVLSDDIASHSARKLKGKQKVVRLGIQGSKQTCGEALSCGSGVAPSQTVVRTELRATTVPTMPNLIESPPDYAFWCFPHASPALTFGAGKRPTAPKDRSKSLISLRKTGAGEGIRTLDPNLGNAAAGCRSPFRRSASISAGLALKLAPGHGGAHETRVQRECEHLRPGEGVPRRIRRSEAGAP